MNNGRRPRPPLPPGQTEDISLILKRKLNFDLWMKSIMGTSNNYYPTPASLRA
jgi:hypothetical protein